jgi:hypothetical protein
VLERAITNLGDASALAISWRNKKVHETIERLAIQMPTGFKHTIRKKIQFSWKIQRHLHSGVFSAGKATNRRTTGR